MIAIRKINEGEFWGDGFKLRMSRDFISYSDAEKHVEIDVESLGRGKGISIYLSSVEDWLHKGKFLRKLEDSDRAFLRNVIDASLSQTNTLFKFE